MKVKWNKFKTIEQVICHNLNIKNIHELELFNSKKYFIKGLKEAKELIMSSLDRPIYVLTDYDCDGICCAIILDRIFKRLKHKNYHIEIPDRHNGYGLSEIYLENISENSLVITADNGITANTVIDKLKNNMNCKVLVLDHHLMSSDGLPNADVIVDPNAIEGSTFNGYCGTGLCYKLAQLLFPNSDLYYDLIIACIATIADAVPLTEENRVIVKKGLKCINEYKNNPVTILLHYLGICHADEDTIGYFIAPIINATGRIDAPQKAYQFFMYGYKELLYELCKINNNRKIMVKEAKEFADLIIIDNRLFKSYPIVIPYDKSYGVKEGIIGIIAGQLADEYKRPVIVLTEVDKGVYKGSARSYNDINIKELLDKCKDNMITYGGHIGAAGLSVKKSKLEDFISNVQSAFAKMDVTVTSDIKYDLKLNVDEINEIMEKLELYSPYGEGNPNPVFYGDIDLISSKGSHYKKMGSANEHIKLNAKDLSLIGFNMADKYAKEDYPKHISVIGNLRYNYYRNNRTNQMNIIDYEVKKSDDNYSHLTNLLNHKLKRIKKEMRRKDEQQ